MFDVNISCTIKFKSDVLYFIKLNKQEPKPTNNVMFSLTYYIYNLHISVFLAKGGSAVSTALVSRAHSKVSGVSGV